MENFGKRKEGKKNKKEKPRLLVEFPEIGKC